MNTPMTTFLCRNSRKPLAAIVPLELPLDHSEIISNRRNTTSKLYLIILPTLISTPRELRPMSTSRLPQIRIAHQSHHRHRNCDVRPPNYLLHLPRCHPDQCQSSKRSLGPRRESPSSSRIGRHGRFKLSEKRLCASQKHALDLHKLVQSKLLLRSRRAPFHSRQLEITLLNGHMRISSHLPCKIQYQLVHLFHLCDRLCMHRLLWRRNAML